MSAGRFVVDSGQGTLAGMASPDQDDATEREKADALADIVAMKGKTYAHITFYNNIAVAETLDEGVQAALESMRNSTT